MVPALKPIKINVGDSQYLVTHPDARDPNGAPRAYAFSQLGAAVEFAIRQSLVTSGRWEIIGADLARTGVAGGYAIDGAFVKRGGYLTQEEFDALLRLPL